MPISHPVLCELQVIPRMQQIQLKGMDFAYICVLLVYDTEQCKSWTETHITANFLQGAVKIFPSIVAGSIMKSDSLPSVPEKTSGQSMRLAAAL